MATGIKVKDAMVSRVITARSSQTVLEGSKIMAKEDVGSLLVVEGSRPIGIVTREDIVAKITAKDLKASEIKIKDIMSTKIISSTPDEDISVAARKMSKYGFERLPVINMGKLVGIISAREIVKVAPAEIEILRERLDMPEQAAMEESTAGYCEVCGNYSEQLFEVNDQWICSACKDEGEGV